jgi:hypothetical protein
MARLLALVTLVAALSVPAAAQAATTIQKVPFEGSVMLCTSGDIVELSGTLLVVSTTTATPDGGFLFADHFQLQGISGVDTTTGTLYRATGLTQDLFTSSKGGVTETTVTRLHIQATTGAESFIVRGVFHIVFGADGTQRVFLDKFSVIC